MFTKSQVIWDSTETVNGVVVSVMLPIQSVVKDAVLVSTYNYTLSMLIGG